MTVLTQIPFAARTVLGALTILTLASCGGNIAQRAQAPVDPDDRSLTASREMLQLVRYCNKAREARQFVLAVGLCRKAHEYHPYHPLPLLWLADSLAAIDQPQHAIQAYQEVLRLKGEHRQATYGIGKTYLTLQQWELAYQYLEDSLRGDEFDAHVYNAMGVGMDQQGRHKEALAYYDKGLRKKPNLMSLRNNIGLSLVMNRRYDEGIAVLSNLVRDPLAGHTSAQNLRHAQAVQRADLYRAMEAGPAAGPQPTPGPLPSPVLTPTRVPAGPGIPVPKPTPQATPSNTSEAPGKPLNIIPPRRPSTTQSSSAGSFVWLDEEGIALAQPARQSHPDTAKP